MNDESQSKAIRDHSPAPNSWLQTIFALIVLIGAAATTTLLVGKYLQNRPLDLYGPSEKAINAVEEVLLANRVPPAFIKKHGPALRRPKEAHWYYYDYRVRIPEALSITGMEELITKRLQGLYPNVFVTDLVKDGRKQGIQLAFDGFIFADIYLARRNPDDYTIDQMAPASVSPAPGRNTRAIELENYLGPFSTTGLLFDGAYRTLDASLLGAGNLSPHDELRNLEANEATQEPVDPPQPPLARLAIILDDGGYGGETSERILSLSSAFTLAILPNTPHGIETARRAAELGFELMLHMPMENLDPTLYPHEGQLDIGMTQETIAQLTHQALDQVPGAVGINNHMGSRFTADPEAMTAFVQAIKNRALYFVDSRTTADTVAYLTAQNHGIRAARRDVFLDHENDPTTIRRQLDEAISIAKDQGKAIAIGHFRSNTVDVLTEMLPLLHEQGVQLVHVSNLIP